MADKKLEPFKITPKPMVKGQPAAEVEPNPAEQQKAQSEAHSVGFRRIETMLEQEEQAVVQHQLNHLQQKLAELEQNSKAAKTKAAAKKAALAVLRTRELIDYLYQTKTAMTPTPG